MSGSVRGAMEQSIVPTRRGVRPPNRAVLVTLGVALTRKSRCHLTDASYPLSSVVVERFGPSADFFGLKFGSRKVDEVVNGLPPSIRKPMQKYIEFLDTPAVVLGHTLEPWRELVEQFRTQWGDCRAFDRISLIAAGVQSKDEKGIADPFVRDLSINPVDRFRSLRLKSGASSWWSEILDQVNDIGQLEKMLLVVWIWGSAKTITKLLPTIQIHLDRLSDEAWQRLMFEHKCLYRFRQKPSTAELIDIQRVGDIENYSVRTRVFLGKRASKKSVERIAVSLVDNINSNCAAEAQFVVDALMMSVKKPSDWSSVLMHLRKLYQWNAIPYVFSKGPTLSNRKSAVEISSNPDMYPIRIVALADSILKAKAGTKAEKLIEIASRENWNC